MSGGETRDGGRRRASLASGERRMREKRRTRVCVALRRSGGCRRRRGQFVKTREKSHLPAYPSAGALSDISSDSIAANLSVQAALPRSAASRLFVP